MRARNTHRENDMRAKHHKPSIAELSIMSFKESNVVILCWYINLADVFGCSML